MRNNQSPLERAIGEYETVCRQLEYLRREQARFTNPVVRREYGQRIANARKAAEAYIEHVRKFEPKYEPMVDYRRI